MSHAHNTNARRRHSSGGPLISLLFMGINNAITPIKKQQIAINAMCKITI
jgi:hypothetical protein